MLWLHALDLFYWQRRNQGRGVDCRGEVCLKILQTQDKACSAKEYFVLVALSHMKPWETSYGHTSSFYKEQQRLFLGLILILSNEIVRKLLCWSLGCQSDATYCLFLFVSPHKYQPQEHLSLLSFFPRACLSLSVIYRSEGGNKVAATEILGQAEGKRKKGVQSIAICMQRQRGSVTLS